LTLLSPKFYPARQRFTADCGGRKVVLEKDKLLSHYGIVLDKHNVVEFKDLGPQVTLRTVYLTEYIGPFFIYIWTFFHPEILYGPHTPGPTQVQLLALICFVGHFGKRIFESAFVHKWGSDTLGIYFLLKNSIYYWLAGLAVGYATNHPSYKPLVGEDYFLAAVIVFWIAQIGNAIVHLQLSRARPKGSVAKVMPHGIIWSITRVSFPNYFFEVIIWITWNIAFFSIPGVLFLFVGTIQMGIWANKKTQILPTNF